MLNKYPYTDFSQINLDWFLQEFQTYKDGWDIAMAAMTTATAAANTAAGAANTAASNANSKATLANNAATSANSAASNANNKAGLAESAASVADSAAQTANSAASNANAKATLANNAATSANTAASNANDKATLANNAATSANTAASNANAAATAAASRVGVLYIPATISGTTVTCDATDADILTALSANKAVIVRVGTDPDLDYFYLAQSETLPGPGAPYAFTFVNKDGDVLVCSVLSGWSYTENIQITTVDTVGGVLTSSMSYSEIVDAVNAGKIVYALYNNIKYSITSIRSTYVTFEQSVLSSGGYYIRITIPESGNPSITSSTAIFSNAVTEITESEGVYSSSMTFAQLKAAFDTGRVLYAKYGNINIALQSYNDNDYFTFVYFIPPDNYYREIQIDSNNTVAVITNIP